jgi:hypothetical protein
MQQAGVAITITSVTDFIAFAIGGSSSLPILRSSLLFFLFFPLHAFVNLGGGGYTSFVYSI